MERGYPEQVAVVGAGVAGCTLAFELSRRGHPVTLIDRAGPGRGGASGVPVALLNPHRGRSGRATPGDLEGLAAFWRLCRDLEAEGLDPGAHRTGVLRIAHSRRQARAWRELGVRWLEPGAVPSPYRAPYGAFLVADGGWLEPARLLATLVAAARRRGAETSFGTEVRKISRETGAFRLTTSAGTLRADRVVVCTGPDRVPGLPWPELERVAGDVIALASTSGPPLPLAGAVYGASLAGRVYIGGNHRPGGSVDRAAAEQLRRAFGWFVPALARAEVVSTWTGVRARRAGNAPLLTELDPGLWFLGALSGRGFLTAAKLARDLADLLHPARPAR